MINCGARFTFYQTSNFSCADHAVVQFNIDEVNDIVWNEDAFANLVLPPGRKQLLRSVVEAHDSETGSGDFVTGKGDGLVINLSGPPGVGTYRGDNPIHMLNLSLLDPISQVKRLQQRQ
jgi:hypothetical protein